MEELRAVARNRLSDEVSHLSDLFQAAGVPESLDSPLGDVHALALAQQGRFDELLDGAETIAAARHAPAAVKARVAVSAAGIAEGLGDLDRALMFWRFAHRLAGGLDPIERLTVRIALARLPRKIGRGAQGRYAHVLAASELLLNAAAEVESYRVTRLEAVAELSGVLQPVQDRQKRVGPDLKRVLPNLFRELAPMFPSAMESRGRLDDLAAILDIPANEVHRPSDLDGQMYRYFNNPAGEFHARALAALRSEVDASFAAVVDRSLARWRDAGSPPHLAY